MRTIRLSFIKDKTKWGRFLLPLIFAFVLISVFPVVNASAWTEAEAARYAEYVANGGRLSMAEFFEQEELRIELNRATIAEEEINQKAEELSGLRKSVWYSLMEILNCSVSIGDQVDEYLRFTSTGEGGTTSLEFTVVTNVYQYLRVIGVGLLIIYFLMDLSKVFLLSGGEFNIKGMVVSFLKFAIGYAVIAKGMWLLSSLFGLNNALLTEFQRRLGGASITAENVVMRNTLTATKESLYGTISELSMWDCLGMMSGLAIVRLLAIGTSAVVMFQAVSRKLEILVRAAMMPVALGDCFNGEQSVGVRNIKKFAALVLWGFAMKLLLQIAGNLSATYLVRNLSDACDLNSMGNLIRLILIPLAAGGMCAALKQVCCDLFGV